MLPAKTKETKQAKIIKTHSKCTPLWPLQQNLPLQSYFKIFTDHYHSVELPLDWLLYYDALSRVSRDPTELYGSKKIPILYSILPDRMKRESHD